MPLKDYQDALTRLHKGLAQAYKDSPQVLNVPGQSVACKVDPHYYLALEPVFLILMARWAVSFPEAVLETLSRTGNAIVCKPLSTHIIPLSVTWGGQDFEVQAMFLLADFVDRALMLYAGAAQPLPVADLRIRTADRAAVEAFFGASTPPQGLAYL